MHLDAAECWEQWLEARRRQPRLTPAEFAARSAASSEEGRAWVRGMIETALEVEAMRPPSPLVDLPFGERSDLEAVGGPGHSTFVFDRWRLLRELGRGGFGIVYEARDEDDPEAAPVALKVLNPLSFADPGRQRELPREAEVIGRLDHPGIVRLVASGVHEGYAWLASERIEGRPLDALEELGGVERTARALRIARRIAAALAAAHAAGVVHRDLKPTNVLVDEDGDAHLLDFGLARVESQSITASWSTRSAGLSGTPLYMAPEQLSGAAPAGPWTDVHALGLLLLVLVEPQVRDTLGDGRLLLRRLAGRPAVGARTLRSVPPRLRPVIGRCLEVQPVDRYPSAELLGEDLERIERGLAPRHGRPTVPRRGLRAARRHPLTALGLLLLGAAPLALVYELWWMAPMPVHFEALLSGKHLVVDGAEIGVTPLTTRLRPGRHTWSMAFQPSRLALRAAHYEGHFDVPNQRSSAVVVALNYWYETRFLPVGGKLRPMHTAHDQPSPRPPQEAAWVLLALRAGGDEGVREFTVSGIDDLGPQVLPALSCFQLPHGVCELTISADGFAPETVAVDTRGPQMSTLTVELARLAEGEAGFVGRAGGWHTVVLAGPFDHRVRGSIATLENLRPYVEYMRASSTDASIHHPNYYGLIDGTRGGVLGLWVDLPVACGELDVELDSPRSLSVDSWARVDVGPSPDRLVPWIGVGHDFAAAGRTVPPDLPPPRPTARTRARLNERMQGARRLFVRFSLAPAPTGDSYSYGRALFSQTLPLTGPDGRLVWRPALVVRVR
ncbi:MAG: serine/threonine-protein kinase [Planctomycetota bacterium]|nr:serine/threonine-protein kinase [Planctomycetota bacterium]